MPMARASRRRLSRAAAAAAAAAARVEGLESRLLLSSTFLVTNASDSGPGSLRQAIADSEANPPGGAGGANEIDFAIAGSTGGAAGGAQTITLASPLPAINLSPVYLNGASQPGYNGAPLIQISGFGLSIGAGSSTVRGLDIVSTNAGPLITLSSRGGNTIQGNYLGVDLTGTAAAGNGEFGVYLNNSAGNLIGGTTAAQRNLIANSTGSADSSGILIFGLNGKNNTIQGNYIGTNSTGTAAVPNAHGVTVQFDGNNNLIGGTSPGAGNVIAGSTISDIFLGAGSQNLNPSNHTTIQGNLIGLNAAGTASLTPAGNAGIDAEYSPGNTIGGTTAAARNVIGGHQSGIYLYGFFGTQGSFNVVQGNYIGTDVTGSIAIPNIEGLVVNSQLDTIGGTTASARNLISGNTIGVELLKPQSPLQGNWVGLNAAGNGVVGNVGNGVLISTSGITVGGTGAGAGNVIAGNGNGITVAGSGATIQGNLIGTDPTGSFAIPNSGAGILVNNQPSTTIGGTTAAARNVISGNGFNGIRVTGGNASGTLIQGNYIGTNAAGAAALPNVAGVSIQGAPKAQVGGAAAGAGNLIAFNYNDGVEITGAAATGNTISRNSIYSNNGPGIDLGADGPTANHSGGNIAGPNNFLNYPVLSSAVVGSASTIASGTVSAAANATFTIELFANPAVGGGGGGAGPVQGKTYLASTSVTTAANGTASFSATLPVLAVGQLLTATLTDAAGDTSEFSPAAVVTIATVLARRVFYNNSVFDGRNTAIGPADDAAIATDKQPLVAGQSASLQSASFANLTSYYKGINGIMLDVAKLPTTSLTAADFSFLAGNTASPSQWSAPPAPAAIQARPGAGVSGSTRIEITWTDGAIKNEWLQVTMNADANTGLGAPDVFYFGNLVSASTPAPAGNQFTITSADEAAARNDLHGFLNPATVVNPHDYHRDGKVDVTDQLIARLNSNRSLPVLQIAAPSSAASASAAAIKPASTASVPTIAPTPQEQYLLALINRARANPAGEAAGFGIDLNEGLAPGTISAAPKQPLAFNPYLMQSATLHSQWMLSNQTFSHDEGSLGPATRMQNAGYAFNAPAGSGENIAIRGTTAATLPLTQTVAQEHQDLFIDSTEFDRAHRLNLMNPSFAEVGVGLVPGNFQGYNALAATQDFAYSAGSGPFLTGIAYSDARIHDHFYEPGEGLGGIIVTATRAADGAAFSTTTWSSGGYTLALPAGTYTVTASGAGLGGAVTDTNIVIGVRNVEVDFTPQVGSYVAGRYVFYNNSLFDGRDAGINAADDNAIATEKQALLPGDTASFANYTSYYKGINGIMVDLGALPGAGAMLKLTDFAFKAGNTSDPNTWAAAPPPAAFVVRAGAAGVGGTTRVEFTWPDRSLRNTWLQVTIAANADTGLLAPDVFYFGNAVGESGNDPSAAVVDATDELVTRSDPHGFLQPAPITNPHDYNRDGKVDVTDQLIARLNAGFSLTLITPPTQPAASSASHAALAPSLVDAPAPKKAKSTARTTDVRRRSDPAI